MKLRNFFSLAFLVAILTATADSGSSIEFLNVKNNNPSTDKPEYFYCTVDVSKAVPGAQFRASNNCEDITGFAKRGGGGALVLTPADTVNKYYFAAWHDPGQDCVGTSGMVNINVTGGAQIKCTYGPIMGRSVFPGAPG